MSTSQQRPSLFLFKRWLKVVRRKKISLRSNMMLSNVSQNMRRQKLHNFLSQLLFVNTHIPLSECGPKTLWMEAPYPLTAVTLSKTSASATSLIGQLIKTPNQKISSPSLRRRELPRLQIMKSLLTNTISKKVRDQTLFAQKRSSCTNTLRKLQKKRRNQIETLTMK